MPTLKPRLAVILDPETRQALDRLSKVSNKPASTWVAEFMNEARPMLNGLADALEAAKAQKIEAFDILGGILASAQVNAAQLSLEMHNDRVSALAKKPAKKKAAPAKKKSGGRRVSTR